MFVQPGLRGRTGLVVRASDSGSGDLGSILGRVGVLFPGARDINSPKVLVIPRNRWLRLNMTEKLFTGILNNKKKAWFVSDLVRNSEDGFSHDASQFVLLISQIPE